MLSAKLIAATEVTAAAFDLLDVCNTGFYLASSPEHLTELAGRGCYLSWDRPNPETASTKDYVEKNILGKGHESVLEHSSATFYVSGVSRSLSHELIRHRHLSFSELSQRFVDVQDARMVMPPAMRDANMLAATAAGVPDHDPEEYAQDSEFFKDVRASYNDTLELFSIAEEDYGVEDIGRKRKREAARWVMPNATETRFTVTGNMRAWRHVIRLRGSLHADAEIRELAVELFRQLREHSPSIFADMTIVKTDDGREYIADDVL